MPVRGPCRRCWRRRCRSRNGAQEPRRCGPDREGALCVANGAAVVAHPYGKFGREHGTPCERPRARRERQRQGARPRLCTPWVGGWDGWGGGLRRDPPGRADRTGGARGGLLVCFGPRERRRAAANAVQAPWGRARPVSRTVFSRPVQIAWVRVREASGGQGSRSSALCLALQLLRRHLSRAGRAS